MVEGTDPVLWRDRPSQLVNMRAFTVCLFVALSVIPLKSFRDDYAEHLGDFTSEINGIFVCMILGSAIVAAWKWYENNCHSYELSHERLSETKGVFNRVTDVLELYRVKDITIEQPMDLRMFGYGNIVMNTSDKSTPIVTIQAVKGVQSLQTIIRERVEDMRKKKGVREFD